MTNQDSKFDITQVTLEDIVIINANIINSTDMTEFPKGKYSNSLKLNFVAAIPKEVANFLRITAKFDIVRQIKDDEGTKATANFDLAFFFKVGNLIELVKDTESGRVVDEELFLNTANIAYSTGRGIIFTRCQGTIMHKLIVPIIPTQKLSESILKNTQVQIIDTKERL